MSCTNTLCLDQLLEPDAPDELVILNNNGSPSAFETGILNLPLGVSTADVLFTTQKLSSEYTFNELAIENLVDVSPLTIQITLTAHTSVGFSVSFSGVTDSANYRLRWGVEVTDV
jgi:hypothetical protein